MPRFKFHQHGLCLVAMLSVIGVHTAQAQLSNRDLHAIDEIAVELTHFTEELHDEYHHHLERVKHGEKLEHDVSQLEKSPTHFTITPMMPVLASGQ